MSKRGYTHIKEFVPAIKAMVAEGKTQREIAEYYGFKDSEVVREALKRDRRKAKKATVGIQPSPKGRPRKDGQPPKQDIQKEIERLRMENKLSQLCNPKRRRSIFRRLFECPVPNAKILCTAHCAFHCMSEKEGT